MRMRLTALGLFIALLAITFKPIPVAAASSAPPKLFGIATLDWESSVADFAADAGKAPAILQVFWTVEQTWPNGWTQTGLTDLHTIGVTAYAEVTTNDLAALNSGDRDAGLQAMASSVSAWLQEDPTRTILIAPLPEANLVEHPWGGDPSGYRAGYARIRKAFLDTGLDGTQIRFVFAMNGISSRGFAYNDFYPGDDSVDIIGFAKLNRNAPWRDYDETFTMHIREMQETVSTAKPILITQTGSVESSGLRDQWLTDMFRGLGQETQVIGALYFNRDKDGYDFRILSGSTLNPVVVSEYANWSSPADVAWIFDGRMDAWVSDRSARIPFDDIAGSTFESDIVWLVDQGITQGCAPTLYCPDNPVTRAQMATFLARALSLPAATNDGTFTDVTNSTHEANIYALAAAGITQGCAPGLYCPDNPVTRAQMAAFLHRALGGA